MRFILIFFLGFAGFFYLAELLRRFFKIYLNWFGLLLIIGAILVGIFDYFGSPLNGLIVGFLLGGGLGLLTLHLLTLHYFISERVEMALVRKHEPFFIRLIEILPGALTWLTLTSPIWLSFTLPFAVAYLIILADAYWLISAIKNAVFIYLGYKKIEWAKKQPWLKMLQKDFPESLDNFYHLLVIPTYKESFKIIKPSVDSIINANYPKQKIFLAVGFEERDDPQKIREIRNYLNKISTKIGGLFVTVHPYGLPGEVPGAGSNRNWIINNFVKEAKKFKKSPEQIFVTTLDADFVLHPEFLAGALHKYLSTSASIRDKRTYTGSFLYYNNYWQAPALTRMIATGTAFWQVSEMVHSDKYMNFSSLSINLKSLLAIGLWIPNKINDDSGFYWKAYYHFRGDYKVIPHFVPINADTVLDVNLLKTIQNQYLQLKRWAYGVEHVPFVFKEYFKSPDIDFWDKTDKLIFALWGYLRWGTLALFVSFAGLLIPLVNPTYKQSVIAVNLPIISSYLLTAAFLGLSATIYVHEKTVPQRPANWGLLQKIWSYLQFLLVPIIVVTISAIPSIDAQTTLMFGRHLEFRVTNKAR